MQIVDCISKMSKFYLKRITNSIVKEQVSKNADENKLRDHISQNLDYLSNVNRIIETLSLREFVRSNRILIEEILRNLLEMPDSKCSEDILYKNILKYEKDIISKSDEIELSNVLDKRDLDIYETILEVALEDDIVTKDEFALIEKLRLKLRINRLQSRLIEAQLGKFPTKKNKLHERIEFDEALKSLQNKGILFFCNLDLVTNTVVLPTDLKQGVKYFLGFEMRKEAHNLFHSDISKNQLQKISKYFDMPSYGKKEEMSSRLIEAGCKPSEELNGLSNSELYSICKNLKGVNVSGTKEQKISKIIEYYDNLDFRKPEDTKDTRAIYYQYLERLARRDNQELNRLNLIKKDKEMEIFFEEGTKYLFEKKLGLNLISFDGTDHPDGGVSFPDGELLLWDNKSKETKYTFPESHYKQFRRYINDSEKRVKIFLIVTCEIDKTSEIIAIKLKQNTKTDTDVLIISANDLKYIAENWKKFQKSDKFNLNTFNLTGILDRARIETYLKLY